MEVKKFFIFNKKPILENDELYDELNVEASSSLELEQLVNKKDLEKFKELIEKGGKQTIRLNRFDGAQIWYYIACDDKQGYLFNVHEIADPKYRINTIDEGLQPAVSSNVIFWDVNPYTEAVSSIFNQPTIWDSLSVDQDWKFNRIVDFVHQDEQEFFNENYYRLLHGDLDKWNGELRLLRFSGQYEWHRISISWNNNLKILHCLAVNIHQQKEAENKLIESQTLRDLLFSSGKLALWTFSNDNNDIEPMHKFDYRSTTVVNMNWKFIDLYIHNDYRNLLKERIKRAFKNDEAIEMDLPLTLDDEIWVSIRGKVRTKSQLIVGVCIDITELRNAYNELEIEKKRAEEANRQKTVFLANMSHEIRTPMNGIFGMLDVLALQELTNEQRILVDSIRSSSFQLMKLLDDTLNMSKIEQGQFEYNPTIFNLTKLFEPICIATSSRARLNHLKFNLIIDKHFPILIYGDSQFFVQIINNLLSNSLKFTREGSITVILSWVEEEDGKELLELIVEDTGIGIGKEQLQVIFKRFSQANESVARFFGGTGLGLSLVQDILHYIGGNINLESELGKGTKFTVHMPYESIYVYFSPMFTDGNRHLILTCIYDPIIKKQLDEWIPYHKYEIKSFVESDEILQYSRLEKCVINAILVEGNSNKWPSFAKAASEISGYKPPIISMCEAGETSYFNLTIAKPVQMIHLMNLLDGFRYHLKNSMPSSNSDSMNDNDGIANVLVVEDNKNNQFVMKKILESLKCKHKIAENGLEAIKKLETDTFDLVFMDCQMPVLDGIEATKRIRRSNKIYASVPIIALTASAIEGDEQTCREAGMDGYIAKPVRIQQIHNIVKQFATRG
ncbi:putative ATPase [Histomonas meleagridis]|uniref:putative ATPase n=1 Tax=Histomonas meleagridis TaxID=135588 RepID=UPI0035599206|nr:putative ATPase [Histomonas meleagridis]KAH0797303.1 putative ATPase [Histomonas meleagridis]